MKVLQGIVLFGIAVVLAGCCGVPVGVPNTATPVVVDNGTQARVLVPCSNDNLCVRNSYEIAKDVWCPDNCFTGGVCCQKDYPVSYRSKNWDYESNRVEYIYMPRTLVVQ